MLNEALEVLGRLGRSADAARIAAEETRQKLNHLRDHGYVMFDHLVGTEHLARLQADYRNRLEVQLDFDTPTLAQSKIHPERDADLIKSNFFGTPAQLAARGLTFDKADIQSYDQAVRDFRPSTLTTRMPDTAEWFGLWLDPKMLPVIEGYLGFVPVLEEAFIRRNYPSDFVVMNHAWHRDTNHSRHLLKAFFFLNDCTLLNGPHHYIAGTVQDRRLDGGRYFSDAEVRALYPAGSARDIVSIVPAGRSSSKTRAACTRRASPNRAIATSASPPSCRPSLCAAAPRSTACHAAPMPGCRKTSAATSRRRSCRPRKCECSWPPLLVQVETSGLPCRRSAFSATRPPPDLVLGGTARASGRPLVKCEASSASCLWWCPACFWRYSAFTQPLCPS